MLSKILCARKKIWVSSFLLLQAVTNFSTSLYAVSTQGRGLLQPSTDDPLPSARVASAGSSSGVTPPERLCHSLGKDQPSGAMSCPLEALLKVSN